jgi:RNA polymerase sigma factor (sigma-70 family)
MPPQLIDWMVGQVHCQVVAHEAAALSDQELLERFVTNREEAAFAALVHRHGRLVLGVCRRLLPEPEAEDALQAVFLVLLRRAASVRRSASISCWLHGVAVRVAGNLRRQIQRRRQRETRVARPEATRDIDELSWGEIRSVLDEELERLPESYRSALVLCYLEGKTRDEAAAILRCSPGVLHGRLERGRQVLRARLSARGLSLSSLGALFLPEGGRLSASSALALARKVANSGSTEGTISATARQLAEETLRSMQVVPKRLGLATILGALLLGLSLAAAAVGPRPAPPAPEVPEKVRPKPTRIVVPAVLDRKGKLEQVILSIDPETGKWKTLLKGPGLHARVSPDRQTVVFERDDGIWNCDTGGAGNPGKLFTWSGGYGGPVWSHDGKHLFVSKVEGVLGSRLWWHRTWRYDAQGRNPEQCKLPGDLAVLDVSPDGRHFLSRARLLTGLNASDLVLIDTDGTKRIRLSPSGGFNEPGRFSPDGKRVAWIRGARVGAGVWVAGIDGKGGQNVASDSGTNFSACCWSPDGKRLAVVASEYGEEGRILTGEPGRWRVEVMDADGGNRRELDLGTKVWMLREPDWHEVAE